MAELPLSYANLSTGEDLGLARIPGIDLYLDQILALLEPADCRLTPAMVHNYSKEGLLPPVKGKKYDRAHVLQLLLICSLKNNLSIQDIKSALLNLVPDSADAEQLVQIYEKGLSLRSAIRETLPDYLEKTAGPLPDGPAERLSLILGLVFMAEQLTQFSRQLIGNAEVNPQPAPGRRGKPKR